MEKYSWWDFAIVTFLVLLVYYAFVFFRYYYPYQSTDGTTTGAVKSEPDGGEGANPGSDRYEMEQNPFIKHFEINNSCRNNITDSNNLRTFARNISESPGRETENDRLFAGLPTVSDQGESEVEDEESVIDLTDILPEWPDIGDVNLYASERFPERENGDKSETDHGTSDDREVGAYLANGLDGFDFGFRENFSEKPENGDPHGKG